MRSARRAGPVVGGGVRSPDHAESHSAGTLWPATRLRLSASITHRRYGSGERTPPPPPPARSNVRTREVCAMSLSEKAHDALEQPLALESSAPSAGLARATESSGEVRKGAKPPPSVLGAVLVEELQAGLVEGGGLLDEVHVTGVGDAPELRARDRGVQLRRGGGRHQDVFGPGG